jgi:small-conductance mechanosensitive channel
MYFYLNETFELVKLKFIDNIPTLLVSIFLFIIFYIVATYYKNLFIKDYVISEELSSTSLINNQIGWLLYYTILIIGIIFAIVNLGISIATIITLLAAFGLAFGLALQGTFGNVINGILISSYDIFGIGDYIKINQFFGDTFEGTVVEFTLNNTTLMENENKNLITLSNTLLQGSIITNLTRSKKYI